MDIKIIKLIAILSILVFFIFEVKIYIDSRNIKDDEFVSESVIVTDENIEDSLSTEEEALLVTSEEKYVINNTVEEILARTERAGNEDKVGGLDGQEIYVLKCSDLTTKPIFHSNIEVPVLYDDYVCVKYNSDESNEQYIMLVYYFNSDDMWDGWYKYMVATSIKEANLIAEREIERGYSVWVSDNIVLEGETFEEVSVSKEEFLDPFLKQFEHVVYMNK